MQNQHSSPFRPPLYVEKKKKNERERERELLNRRKAEQKELKLIQDARQAATPTLSYPIHSFLFGLPSAVTPRLGTDGDRNNKTYRSRQTAKTNLAIYNPQRRDRDARRPHGVSRSRLLGFCSHVCTLRGDGARDVRRGRFRPGVQNKILGAGRED